MLPHSSFPEKSSQRDIVQLLTVFLPPVANLVLSLPKLVSVNLRTLVAPTNSSSTCKLIPFGVDFSFADLFYFILFCFFSLEIFALFMLTGIFSTLLLPETKGRSLEELSNEDQDTFVAG